MEFFQAPGRQEITARVRAALSSLNKKKHGIRKIRMPCSMESMEPIDYLPASSKFTFASSFAFTVTF